MFKQFTNRVSNISPRVAIVGALILVAGVAGIALLLTRGGSEAKAASALQPRAARIERVDGSVGITRAESEDSQLDWAEATLNTPVTVGDRIYARDDSHASIALTGHNYVRLNPATSLDVLSLEERRTQLALRDGSALFDVGTLGEEELFEVATPCGAVDFREPGLYQVGMDGGNAIISVLSGLAQVVGLEGSGLINKGQVYTLVGASSTQALASTLSPSLAGEVVDDYYRYRYPRVYDGRYRSYDAYVADPFYYDPYRTSVSYQYLPADIPGLYDLDYYGDWEDVNDYGRCWAPRVNAGWAPFRSGYWDLDDMWGPSWVSSEPWGWAPYHYGRWAFINQRWFWVPVEVRTRPVYCPAPVAFIPFEEQIAWVPLGPGELYVPRYYDMDFQPRYLASSEVINVVTAQQTFINFNSPGGVTVVPVRALTRPIDLRVITPVDVRVLAKSRHVIDPFSVPRVRELAVGHEDGRRRFKLEGRVLETFNRPVVTSANPELLAVRGKAAKALRLETVSDNRKEKKLRVEPATQVTTARRPDGLPQPLVQSQRMSELASRADQGDKSARREMRQLMREERRATQQSQTPASDQQAQQQQMKQQRRAERQQQTQAAAGQEAARQAQQQQMKQQRRAERQQQTQAAAGQEAARQDQQQQMKQQRRADRQQAAQQDAARQAQQQQRHQQQQQMRQQEQQRQQQKQQKRKPPEASVQQQQVRQAERIQRAQQEAARQAQVGRQQEQLKAQRRADQQRQAMMQQQSARAQAAQRQAIQQQQQAARAQAAQRQAIQQQQQAARAQAAQRQAVQQQQQSARAQAAQRQAAQQQQQRQAAQAQAAQRQSQRNPAFLGPPVRDNAGSQSPRKAEKSQRKPPQ